MMLGRMDAIVRLRPLGEKVLAEIAERQLRAALDLAARQGLRVTVRGNPAALLARAGVGDPAGARGVRHRIQELVEGPLAELLLRGAVYTELDCRDGEIRFRNPSAQRPRAMMF